MQKADKVAAGVVVGIAAGAFALSYEALRFVYLGANGHAKLSVIYPLIAEGFVTVAVWVAYRLRDWGWKATAYPWTLAGMFFAYSLWSNSLPDTVPAPVVRGVPSLAVPLAVHLFTHMVKRRTAVTAELVAELVTEDDEELMSDEPWDEWQAPIFEKAPADLYGDDQETGTRSIFGEIEKPIVAHASASSDSSLIRSWAKRNGYQVKGTGRIPDAILRAYAKAHGGELVTA